MTNLRLLCTLIVLAAVCGQAQSYPDREMIKVSNGSPWGGWSMPQFCPEGSYAGAFTIKVEKNQDLADDTALNGIGLECFKNGKSIGKSVTSNAGYWGYWRTPTKYCSSGFTRFMLKVESPGGDDTAANNIRFSCSNGKDLTGPDRNTGDWGDWGSWSNSCSAGKVICGIQTQVEGKQGLGDDTALNDVRFYCCKK